MIMDNQSPDTVTTIITFNVNVSDLPDNMVTPAVKDKIVENFYKILEKRNKILPPYVLPLWSFNKSGDNSTTIHHL